MRPITFFALTFTGGIGFGLKSGSKADITRFNLKVLR